MKEDKRLISKISEAILCSCKISIVPMVFMISRLHISNIIEYLGTSIFVYLGLTIINAYLLFFIKDYFKK